MKVTDNNAPSFKDMVDNYPRLSHGISFDPPASYMQALEEEYDHLAEAFHIYSSLWDYNHLYYTGLTTAAIGEYFTWLAFTRKADSAGFECAQAIKTFLKVYKPFVDKVVNF